MPLDAKSRAVIIGTGVAGVNWNVQIMALKFLDASGSGYSSDAIVCIQYGVGKGDALGALCKGGPLWMGAAGCLAGGLRPDMPSSGIISRVVNEFTVRRREKEVKDALSGGR